MASEQVSVSAPLDPHVWVPPSPGALPHPHPQQAAWSQRGLSVVPCGRCLGTPSPQGGLTQSEAPPVAATCAAVSLGSNEPITLAEPQGGRIWEWAQPARGSRAGERPDSGPVPSGGAAPPWRRGHCGQGAGAAGWGLETHSLSLAVPVPALASVPVPRLCPRSVKCCRQEATPWEGLPSLCWVEFSVGRTDINSSGCSDKMGSDPQSPRRPRGRPAEAAPQLCAVSQCLMVPCPVSDSQGPCRLGLKRCLGLGPWSPPTGLSLEHVASWAPTLGP